MEEGSAVVTLQALAAVQIDGSSSERARERLILNNKLKGREGARDVVGCCFGIGGQAGAVGT